MLADLVDGLGLSFGDEDRLGFEDKCQVGTYPLFLGFPSQPPLRTKESRGITHSVAPRSLAALPFSPHRLCLCSGTVFALGRKGAGNSLLCHLLIGGAFRPVLRLEVYRSPHRRTQQVQVSDLEVRTPLPLGTICGFSAFSTVHVRRGRALLSAQATPSPRRALLRPHSA